MNGISESVQLCRAARSPLALKYPNASRELGWQWIFPATRMQRDHMSGERRRHHLDESVLQRAVQEAVRGAGLHKPVRCHTFRQMCSCTFDLLPRPESGLGRCSYFHGFPLMAISRITCLCSGVLIFAGLFGRAITRFPRPASLNLGRIVRRHTLSRENGVFLDSEGKSQASKPDSTYCSTGSAQAALSLPRSFSNHHNKCY